MDLFGLNDLVVADEPVATLGQATMICRDHGRIFATPDGKFAITRRGDWFDLEAGRKIDPPFPLLENAHIHSVLDDGTVVVETPKQLEFYPPGEKRPKRTLDTLGRRTWVAGGGADHRPVDEPTRRRKGQGPQVGRLGPTGEELGGIEVDAQGGQLGEGQQEPADAVLPGHVGGDHGVRAIAEDGGHLLGEHPSGAGFHEDPDAGRAVPEEPDRVRRGCAGRRDRRQPDHRLLGEAPGDPGVERVVVVEDETHDHNTRTATAGSCREPSQTRPKLIKALRTLETKRVAQPRRKHGNIPL